MIPNAKVMIGKEEEQGVLEVLRSGMLAQGPKVKDLEEKFAAYSGTKYAVAVNSGTAAIHASLFALGVKPGDEVITVPFTFAATANPIIMLGAKPVFVDVDAETFNIDPGQIEGRITSRTKAIIVVDLYGQVYDADAVSKIAAKDNLLIVEDACQAVGASLNGRKAGSFGDLAAFSFYGTKNMTCGEGGMITTDDPELAELARRFRHHGQSEQTRYEYHHLGYNYRMMDLQAAIALAQLNKIEAFTEARIRNAKLLTDGLKGIKGISTPIIRQGARHVFHQYTIKVDGYKLSRDELAAKLKEKGVGSGVYYPKPLHLHPFYARMGYREGDFPVSERLSKIVLSLPVHPGVSREDVKHIIETIRGL
jgi:perosamine synthetase